MCGKAARLEDPVTVRWHNPIWTMVRMRGVGERGEELGRVVMTLCNERIAEFEKAG